MNTFIYSLKTINDKSYLSIDLIGKITAENKHNIQLKLTPTSQVITLNKWDYLNKMRIYEDAETGIFFLICNKQVSHISAFEKLMEYAINKIDTRVEKLLTAKNRYKKEISEFKSMKRVATAA